MRQKPVQPPQLLPSDSGVILAEACIGLALVVFTWAMLSITSYMSTNNIRALMASRHGAWLLGNSEGDANLSDSLKQQFFFEADQPYVEISATSAGLSIPGALTAAGSGASGNAPKGDDSWIVTVKFGRTEDTIGTIDRFPLTLLKTKLAFMPETKLTNWLQLESQAAWPANCNETWESFGTAMVQVIDMLLNQVRGFF